MKTKKPNVIRKIAVENFLGSLDRSLSKKDHLMNLSIDANLYRWNVKTVNAIRRGVTLLYQGKPLEDVLTYVLKPETVRSIT